MRALKLLLLLPVALLASCQETRAPAQPAAKLAAAAEPSTSRMDFLAMGDWGENTRAEREVAAAMGRYPAAEHIEPSLKAVVLCGDNFYFKLTGIDDPRWDTLFEHMYDPKSLAVPFYASLGNHDYDGNNHDLELAYAKRHADSRFKMPAGWYRVDVPEQNPMLTLIVLDSNREKLSDAQWAAQIAWLKAQLSGPRATWTICCAHHPLFSNGFFWGNGVLQKDWGTLFEKYHVDFYLCGHEHDLEHLEIPGWKESFVIAGGGGAHVHPLSRDDRGFSREAYGFAHFELTPEQATVRFVDTAGKPLHVFTRSKAGAVKVLETVPNTPRENPLKAYLQLKGHKPQTQPDPETQPFP